MNSDQGAPRARRTEDVLEDLVGGLEPVRRSPRLGVVLGLVAMLWLAIAGVGWLCGAGLRPDFLSAIRSDLSFALIFAGLLPLGCGAVLLALSASVPGRGETARVGRWLAGAGAGLAFLLAPARIWLHAAGFSVSVAPEDLYCVAGALTVAALPGIAAVAFVLWAAPRRPALTAIVAALGAAGLGAVVIHAHCPAMGARHWVFGHALAPLGIALVLALPLLGLARWHSGRRILQS